MSMCSQICQHPACWRAELELKKTNLRNSGKTSSRNSTKLIYDHEVDQNTVSSSFGSLPTYKIINLMEDGQLMPNEPYNNQKDQEQFRDVLTDRSQNRFSSASNLSETIQSNNYIKKLRNRQKEVQQIEKERIKQQMNDTAKIVSLNVLKMENVEMFGGDFSKVYTWVPGVKVDVKTKESSNEQKLNLKTIDGNLLPDQLAFQSENKLPPRKLTSPTNMFKRRLSNRIPADFLTQEIIDTYCLLDIPLSFGTNPKLNDHNVSMPSPLRTNRVDFHDFPTESSFQQNIQKAKVKMEETNCGQVSPQPKLLYIKDGRLLSRSPSFLKRADRLKHARQTLTLTRVSVPKKAIRKYPIFDHCVSSIRQTNLPDIKIQPLTHSEESSEVSSRMSMVTPLQSIIADNQNTQFKNEDVFVVKSHDTDLNLVTTRQSSVGNKPKVDENKILSVDIEANQQRPNTAPSAITISRDSTSLLKSHVYLAGEINSHGVNKSNTYDFNTHYYNNAQGVYNTRDTKDLYDDNIRNSPSPSDLSKFSSNELSMDRDIIKRTYDKYQSLTPYTTPFNSKHMINTNDAERNVSLANNLNCSNLSKRIILHESRHNLNQYLPTDEQTLATNTSFVIPRSLTPSLNTTRQLRQPSFNTVPSEIKISQLHLNPSRTKSPYVSEHRKYKNDTQQIRKKIVEELETMKSPIQGPPPTPIMAEGTAVCSQRPCNSISSEMNSNLRTLIEPAQNINDENGNEILMKLHCVNEVTGVDTNSEARDYETADCKVNANISESTVGMLDIEPIIIPTSEDIVSDQDTCYFESHCTDNDDNQDKRAPFESFMKNRSLITNNSIDSIDSVELVKLRQQIINTTLSDKNNNVIEDTTCTENLSPELSTDKNALLEMEMLDTEIDQKNRSSNDAVKNPNQSEVDISSQSHVDTFIQSEDKESNNQLEMNVLSKNYSEVDSRVDTSESNSSFEATISYQDFTEGLNLELDLDDEILKAMNGGDFNIDDFVNDS